MGSSLETGNYKRAPGGSERYYRSCAHSGGSPGDHGGLYDRVYRKIRYAIREVVRNRFDDPRDIGERERMDREMRKGNPSRRRENARHRHYCFTTAAWTSSPSPRVAGGKRNYIASGSFFFFIPSLNRRGILLAHIFA